MNTWVKVRLTVLGRALVITFSSVKFSCSVHPDYLRPHDPQHAKPLCPSPTPGVHPNPCSLSQWCHLTISSSVNLSLPALNLSQNHGLFKWVSSLHQVAKHWTFRFNISPSNEHPALISFRMDWLDLLPRDSQMSSPTSQFKSISSLALSFLHSPHLTSIRDPWKNHSLD